MVYRLYISVTGKDQRAFTAETPEAGAGRSVCHGFRFKGTAHNDPTRAKGVGVASHEPLTIVKPWGASSPQFLQAFWANEVLEDVHLVFVRPDGKGSAEKTFQEIHLKNATVASVEHIAGHGVLAPEGAPAELEEIALRFEGMKIENVEGRTAAQYDWKKQG
jgi:type VI secretion system Hcp family effector